MPTPFEPGNHVLNTFSTVTSNACRKPPQRGVCSSLHRWHVATYGFVLATERQYYQGGHPHRPGPIKTRGPSPWTARLWSRCNWNIQTRSRAGHIPNPGKANRMLLFCIAAVVRFIWFPAHPPLNATCELWAEGLRSPGGRLCADAQLDCNSQVHERTCSCQAWLCLCHRKPKGNKRRSRPGQPRGVLHIWNLNVAFLQSWKLAEATTRGFLATCCQIHLTAVPFGAKQNLSSAAPRNRQPETRCPLNLHGCALLISSIADQIPGLSGSVFRRSGRQRYKARQQPGITTCCSAIT